MPARRPAGDPRRAGRVEMSAPVTVTPVLVADLAVEGDRMPVYAHVIDHPDGRVLVDTGIKELHPAVADMDPRLRPWSEKDMSVDTGKRAPNTCSLPLLKPITRAARQSRISSRRFSMARGHAQRLRCLPWHLNSSRKKNWMNSKG